MTINADYEQNIEEFLNRKLAEVNRHDREYLRTVFDQYRGHVERAAAAKIRKQAEDEIERNVLSVLIPGRSNNRNGRRYAADLIDPDVRKS